MGYSTSLVFFYGVEETIEIRNSCRVKTVMKDIKSCPAAWCKSLDSRYCEKCNGVLRPGDNFCASCGTGKKFDGTFCRNCGQKKIPSQKSVTETICPEEAYNDMQPDDESDNYIMASFPLGNGIYIGYRIGNSYDCRDEAGLGFEIPTVPDHVKTNTEFLLKRLKIVDAPRLFAVLQVT